jgi:hypothetical protein
MSCVCKDNHLLRCCIDIYCSSTLYTGELDELKLSDDNTLLPLVIIRHTIHHHYIAPTLTHSLIEYFKVKVKVKVSLRLTVGQSVSLGVEPHLGLMTRYLLLLDSYGLFFVGRPLWREGGSGFCICCWPSPAQCFSGPSPFTLATIIVLRLPFSSPPTTRRVTVEVFDPASTRYFYHYVFLYNLESDPIENTSLSVLL